MTDWDEGVRVMYVTEEDGRVRQRNIAHVERGEDGRWVPVPVLREGESYERTFTGETHIVPAPR